MTKVHNKFCLKTLIDSDEHENFNLEKKERKEEKKRHDTKYCEKQTIKGKICQRTVNEAVYGRINWPKSSINKD